MRYKTTHVVTVITVLVAAASLTASALSAPRSNPALKIVIVGPTKNVVWGTNVPYTLMLRNTGNVTFNRVVLSFIPSNELVRSSAKYAKTFRPLFKTYSVYWSIAHFRPRTTYTVRLVLNFPIIPGGDRGTSFGIEAHAFGPYAFKFISPSVYFKQS